MTQTTVFEVVGGQPFFDALVERFSARVETDPTLRPLYPPDLAPGIRALALFLGQYFGGPPTYSEEKGHPRLRMRHAPFAIGPGERDLWLTHMRASLERAAPAGDVAAELWRYFEMAAEAMRNRD